MGKEEEGQIDGDCGHNACTLHHAPATSYPMIVQIKMPKDRSTEVCNWVLGGSYEVCLSSNFSLSCALVAAVFCCTLCAAPSSRRRQVCGIAQAVRVPEGKTGHVWTAILAFLAVFISCQKMSCNLFLLAFVLGIGGAFQYGLQISIINSPAEVSMNSSKNWAHSKNFNVLMHSCFYLQSLTFSLLLSQLDLLWFLGSNSSCYCSCVSLCFNFCLVWQNCERGGWVIPTESAISPLLS